MGSKTHAKKHNFVNHLENEKLRKSNQFYTFVNPYLDHFYMPRHCVRITTANITNKVLVFMEYIFY